MGKCLDTGDGAQWSWPPRSTDMPPALRAGETHGLICGLGLHFEGAPGDTGCRGTIPSPGIRKGCHTAPPRPLPPSSAESKP